MPKNPTATSTIRRHIELHPQTADRLERLRDALEATSDSEIFRRALQVLEALIQDEQSGKMLCIKDQSGEITAVSVRYGGAGTHGYRPPSRANAR